VLGAPTVELSEFRARALKNGIDVVDFPSQGQQTNDYLEFGARVRAASTEELTYVGVGVYGPRKSVGKVVGRFSLLK
jgi:hypothetical protein